MSALRLGVLVSGEGTNLQAILDAIADGRLAAEVPVVVSNRPDARALGRARAAGLAVVALDHRTFETREAFDAALRDAVSACHVDYVVLAGFMRLLGPTFLDAFPERVINVHPSLLPAFPGARAVRDALAHGVKVTGCTVHLVDAGIDSGAILAQRAVPVRDGDDEESLLARLHQAEHDALVETLIAASRARLHLERGPRPRARWVAR